MEAYLVNAFTHKPFTGNPAMVCIVPDFSEGCSYTNAAFLQTVAREMNAAETVFVYPSKRDGTDFHLRFFTKKKEMALCGHATLAAAHVLCTERGIDKKTLIFTIGSDLKLMTIQVHGADVYELTLPIVPCRPAEVSSALSLCAALGVPESELEATMMQGKNVVLVLKSEAAVRQITPNYEKLMKAAPEGMAKIFISAKADSGKDYSVIARLFAPWIGINEDAVSGATYAAMGAYWMKVLGKDSLRCFQASQRSGYLNLKMTAEGKVSVAGDAVVITQAVFRPSKL